MIGNLLFNLEYKENDNNCKDLLQYFVSNYKNYTQFLSFSNVFIVFNNFLNGDLLMFYSYVLFNQYKPKEYGICEGSWCSLNFPKLYLTLTLTITLLLK